MNYIGLGKMKDCPDIVVYAKNAVFFLSNLAKLKLID